MASYEGIYYLYKYNKIGFDGLLKQALSLNLLPQVTKQMVADSRLARGLRKAHIPAFSDSLLTPEEYTPLYYRLENEFCKSVNVVFQLVADGYSPFNFNELKHVSTGDISPCMMFRCIKDSDVENSILGGFSGVDKNLIKNKIQTIDSYVNSKATGSCTLALATPRSNYEIS